MIIITHLLKWAQKLSIRKSTKYIFLHCTATPEGRNYTVEQVHQMHIANKWAGIGYHYLIELDGSIHEGRPDNTVGAHAGSTYNPSSIGIVYVGGCGKDMRAKDTRAIEQKMALFSIVRYCMNKFDVPLANVRAHYEVANKACPSFNINNFRKEFTEWAKTH